MQEAKRRFIDLVHRGEANEAAVFFLAQIAERSGDAETALTEYRQLSDTDWALRASVRAAGILLAGGKRGEALELLDGYESEHPESDFELTLARAHLLGEHHDADGGVSVLTTALQRYPQHPTLEYERAVMLERAGRDHQAVEALEQLLATRPEDPNLLNALGYTLADHGQTLSRAETLIRQALRSTPDNPAVLDSLAWVRVRRGDPAGATPILERAYTISRDPEIAAHYGEALWLAGNHARARRVWAEALARDPDSDELKATLKRLLPPGHP